MKINKATVGLNIPGVKAEVELTPDSKSTTKEDIPEKAYTKKKKNLFAPRYSKTPKYLWKNIGMERYQLYEYSSNLKEYLVNKQANVLTLLEIDSWAKENNYKRDIDFTLETFYYNTY